jgi:hypothetical protein
MPHLIASIQNLSIAECLAQVQVAHDYLVHCATTALQAVDFTQPDRYWGAKLKRVTVTLDAGNRPGLIDARIETHNLTEVYNQCATMERLIDALAWVMEAFPDYHVVCCHPTTSSLKTSDVDNDLVLGNAAGELACFEVSDVAGARDTNRKEEKDLRSLGLFNEDVLMNRRNFLVVSAEFASILRDYPRKLPDYRYHRRYDNQHTCILEILPFQSD